MLLIVLLGVSIAIGLFAFQGCNEDPVGGDPDSDPGQELDLALCSPTNSGFTTASTNPYFPLDVGSELILEGEEDGAMIGVEIRVLDEIETVAGVDTRVVEERETEDGELIEVSRNFFVQAGDGTVCYFGEDVDFLEDGEVVSHEGAWRADGAANRPGIIMPADPQPGTRFQMESAPGIAEDEGEVVEVGVPEDVPAGAFTDTVRIRERNPLDGDVGEKVFAAGVGLIVDAELELVSSE